MRIITTILLTVLLLNVKAQDTTYNTYSYPCDSVVTTIIPADTILVGYHDSTLFDTSYNVFYNTQLYSTVDGSITVSIPDYVIIAAHDTTFTCSGCGTCYATDTIITPEPDQRIYGMFTNTGGFLPFANQIHTAKVYSCNAVRDNIDEGRAWKVKQAHDSGMIDLMTYNSPGCCNLQYFNTGSALTTALNTLSNYFRSNPNDKPELISFNNEEPNFGYWKGKPQDYINWLNRATDTAHKYGVPVSNGGILHTVYWYIRYVYQQEGKTDSVALINSIFGLGPGTPAWGQAIIDWYKVEIPGLAASNIDYVNFHNYFNGLTPSEMQYINILIRFLGSRTGKPVITTEGGVTNATQAQLFEYYDRMVAEGVNIIVYYNGDGNLTTAHPDWFSNWINQ